MSIETTIPARAEARRTSLSEFLAAVAVALAVPLNFLFAMSGAFNWVPRALEFELAEVALLAALLVWLAERRWRIGVSTGDCLFLAYLLWCSLIVAYHTLIGPVFVDELGRSMGSFNRAVLMLEVFWYAMGRVLIHKYPPTARVLLLFYALLLLSVAVNTNPEGLKVDFGEIDDDGLNYLAVADPFAIWAFLLLGSVAERRVRSALVWTTALLALFVIGSRGTLYSFIGAGIIFGFVVAPRLWTLIGAAFAVSAAGLISYAIDNWSDLGRMFALFTISQDSSFLEREDFRSTGQQRIWENPLTGDYGGVIKDFGNIGAYIHDITSYWQQFGLGPFLLLLALLGIAARTFIRAARKVRSGAKRDPIDVFLVLYFPFVIIQLLTARSYDWPFCWLLVGLAIARRGAPATAPGMPRMLQSPSHLA